MGGLGSIDSQSQDTVTFTINGVKYTVDETIPAGTSLNVYLREHVNLRGTKAMCLEGGCGVCVVAAKIQDQIMSVNSCLVPILICDGWEITTIEGIGNRKSGYHPLQARLAQMNGSQCGYCSPGFVMNMYSLFKSKQPTMKEIENSFGSNICRCTGYRPILDTFKSFASDTDPELKKTVQDIEEVHKLKTCPKSGEPCKGSCSPASKSNVPGFRHLLLEDAEFYKVVTVDELFSVFQKHPDESYVLNGGNTAHGVYRLEKPDLYIDLNSIPDLHRVKLDKEYLALGGNLSLTEAMEAFNKYSKYKSFEYLKYLADHIDLIAHVPVRNIGTMAGNLMIKHQHREFPSDLFLILETAGAELHILEDPGKKRSVTLLEFLDLHMRHKLIYSINLPARKQEYKYRSYKVMPRAQNAHAIVNAGFLFKLNTSGRITDTPNIIIGGIRPDFLHATKTENYLRGKMLWNNEVLQQAFRILEDEVNPDHVLPDYSPKYRSMLAVGLFYRFILSVTKSETINPKHRSGAAVLERGLSSGKQDFQSDKNLWPLNQSVPKLEGIYQTSGEALYINDIKTMPNEVFCAFVLTDVPNGYIEHVDYSEAMDMKGFVAFYGASDIPGKNLAIVAGSSKVFFPYDEPLFAESAVLYAGQPIGVIAATSAAIANEAAKKVKVIYTGTFDKKPIVTIEDVLASKDKSRIATIVVSPATKKGTDVKHVIKGVFACGGQYHFTMETQTCVCVPIEGGIDVYPATHWIDINQISIAECLNMPQNSINISVKRLGGGYGGKISRSAQVACACALVCRKLNRPARFVMTIEENMSSIGKRPVTRNEYEVGVNDQGKIQYLNSQTWSTAGAIFNEPTAPHIATSSGNCYDTATWALEGNEVRTDTPSNTSMRAPGSLEGIVLTENIMEHIARAIGKDPIEVRLANLNPADNNLMKKLMDDLRMTSNYDTRKEAVNAFNRESRWKKKGIAIVPMKWGLKFFGPFSALVSIFAFDGTVAITHGGIEMGQGINTKVAQVAAHILGIDLDLISIKPSASLTSPNDTVTGGSYTSQSCAYATMMACQELSERLSPLKTSMNNPPWKELVRAAYEQEIDLSARYMFSPKKNEVISYAIWGCAVSEVEVDMLTGQHIVTRVDIMADTGVSMSPGIDIGQVEGAFIMGIGLWTSEELIYDPETAVLTNNRTWNYKPPGAKDIPVDFRVSFRRNAPNPFGVLRSKAASEPPICTSCGILFAIRNALNAARADAGNTDKWYNLHGPATTEKILLTSLTSKEQMTL